MTGLWGRSWYHFVWDEHNEYHLSVHGIQTDEAEEVFFNRYVIVPNKRRHGPRRFMIDGKTDAGRKLRIVFEEARSPDHHRVGTMKKKKRPKGFKPYRYNEKEWDVDKAVEVTPDKRLRAVSTSIRLPMEMVQKLRQIARRKGSIGYQTLLKIWIAERLEKESA